MRQVEVITCALGASCLLGRGFSCGFWASWDGWSGKATANRCNPRKAIKASELFCTLPAPAHSTIGVKKKNQLLIGDSAFQRLQTCTCLGAGSRASGICGGVIAEGDADDREEPSQCLDCGCCAGSSTALRPRAMPGHC